MVGESAEEFRGNLGKAWTALVKKFVPLQLYTIKYVMILDLNFTFPSLPLFDLEVLKHSFIRTS